MISDFNLQPRSDKEHRKQPLNDAMTKIERHVPYEPTHSTRGRVLMCEHQTNGEINSRSRVVSKGYLCGL